MIRKRVGLVAPRYSPAVGGVELHVERLARGLVARGFEVEVITTDPEGKLPPVGQQDGVLVRRFPTILHDGVFFVSPQLAWWLIHNADQFSLLHAHSYHTPLALQAAIAGRLHRIPLVFTPHYHGVGHSTIRQALHTPYKPLAGWLINHAHQIICVSESERQLLEENFGQGLPTEVIPNGVEIDDFKPIQPEPKPDGQILVMYAGRLERYKNVERIVAALPHLPNSHQLTITGDGPARQAIMKTANTLGVETRVHCLGKVSREELLSIYLAADVFVTMSSHEAFGITILEAAAAGVPVVASDIPAHREVGSYTEESAISYVHQSCSPKKLAHAIQKAAQGKMIGQYPSLALPTWDSAVEATISCYEKALRHKSPTALGRRSDASQ